MTPTLSLYFTHNLKMNPIFQWNEAQQITENKFQCSHADNPPRPVLQRVLSPPVRRDICLLRLDSPHFVVIFTRDVCSWDMEFLSKLLSVDLWGMDSLLLRVWEIKGHAQPQALTLKALSIPYKMTKEAAKPTFYFPTLDLDLFSNAMTFLSGFLHKALSEHK